MIITLQTLIFFRESLLNALDRLLRPYYSKFSLTFGRNGDVSDDEESDDQVFAEFDEEKGVVFYPPVYLQRYAAVSDCLIDERWCGKLDKVVDLGYHDMSFIKYLKEVSGIRCILGVDIESIPLRCSSDLMGYDDYGPKRESPLQVTLFQGNAADPDYRLIGCDAVIAIEMIEHMLPHDLDRLVHTVFGFIKPWVAIFTTPNGDFNVLFKAMEKNGFRRWDHFFEWSREQFNDWCSNIVSRYPEYTVSCKGIGPGPPGTLHIGSCSQMAVFISKDYHKQQDLNLDSLALVANAPSPYNVSELISTWDSSEVPNESNMICPPMKLNCTTLQVKKFSKTTQNLIAKNKVDSLVHTREVVDEIRHLTKMLNFNKDNPPIENGVHTWNNINWGDNAPYWNQYYKVVREYNPPYESKSEESRITELISDEINRLIDNQFFDDFSVDLNRLEIPIEHLMNVVAHITDDVEKVKELLEWDGYEVVDNVVIHSRLVVDNASTLCTQEDDWPDNDTYSDWDSTDVHSTSLSDGSTMVPDYHARCLRRALDQKVRKLRTMLTADEDITSELDKIVCRLMKLALRTSRGRHSPPPTRWMQCKLLDLLTLTEKAIERRKRYFIENYPLKSINYVDNPSEKSLEMIALDKIREDDTALKIVDKYRHLVQAEKTGIAEVSPAKYSFVDLELEDDLSVTSAAFLKDYEFIDRHSPSLYGPEPTLTDMALYDPSNDKTKLERTQAWLEDDLEMVPYPNHDMNFDDISSGDTEHSTSLSRYYKKSYKRFKTNKQSIELKCVICKRSHSKYFRNESKKDKKIKDKTSKTKVIKKVSKRKSSNNNLLRDTSNKRVAVDYRQYRIKPRKKEHKSLQPTASKPVPQNTAGAIAVQAFSGFSINGELLAGDRPDPTNFVDSETGSMAVDVSRQANSEELFISGRSSNSDSCLIDEEAVVPSWLFQIISQQQAAEDEIGQPQIPLPMPDDPLFDANGNEVEGVGFGAGAGDGRGMHSDQSQDSSGRGTSLSSSATSSGAQSEAILIDPSAFVAQYEGVALLQDSEDSSIVMVGINNEDNVLGNLEGVVPTAPDLQSFSHGESRRTPRVQVTTASDVDADVSSLETDVLDSSDN